MRIWSSGSQPEPAPWAPGQVGPPPPRTGGDVVLSWQATCWLGADGDGVDVVHTLVAPDVLAVQYTNPIVTIPAEINRCRRIKLLRRFTVSIVSRDRGSPDRVESQQNVFIPTRRRLNYRLIISSTLHPSVVLRRPCSLAWNAVPELMV
jgi:hypothetical protein